MALKCKLLYPVAGQSHHEVINCIILQALYAKTGNINSGLSLELTSFVGCLDSWFCFGLGLFLLLFLFNK